MPPLLLPCHWPWDLNDCPLPKLDVGAQPLKLLHPTQFTAADFLLLREPTLTQGTCRNVEGCNKVSIRRANLLNQISARATKSPSAPSKVVGMPGPQRPVAEGSDVAPQMPPKIIPPKGGGEHSTTDR